MTSLEQRFWSKVDKIDDDDSCWLWVASCRNGYGAFWNGYMLEGAHCVSFQLSGGLLLPGQLVLHTCDTPGCVRPKHLYAGTNEDNNRDIVNRTRFSARTYSTPEMFAPKLTSDEVQTIRQLHSTGDYSRNLLSTMYSVSRKTIYNILEYRTWVR